MNDMFKFFGISYYKDGYKVRFANDAKRARVLERVGHTEVCFVEMPELMSKVDGIVAISNMEPFQHVAARDAIDSFLAAYEARAERNDKVKKPRVKRVKEEDGLIDEEDSILAQAKLVAQKDRELVTVDSEDEPF